jgi:hypothetical protein
MRVLLAVLALAGSTYTDPPGDAAGAPDVTSGSVRATETAVAFTAQTADAGAWQGAVAFLSIDLNGDGRTDVDYTLHSLHDLVTRDTGSGALPTVATATLSGATLTYVVPLAELGQAATIGFALRTAQSGSDRAPDDGLWRVRIRIAFAPARPVHGERFAVSGATRCTARLAGVLLRGRCSWLIPAGAKGKTLVVTADARVYRFSVR